MISKLKNSHESQNAWKRQLLSARRISLACLVLGLIALCVSLLTLRSNRSIDKIAPLADVETAVELANRTDVLSSTDPELPANDSVRGVGVLVNPCIARTGEGEAYGIATSLERTIEGGARFQILDDSGALLEGTLPFFPRKSRLGRSAYGSVLAGYGDVHWKEHFSPFDVTGDTGAVRVYLDGQLEYVTENAIDFGVAQDASAFFTIERASNESIVMKVRQLQPYLLREHALDPGYPSRSPTRLLYRWRFSQDYSDIILVPSSRGAPTRFVPVGSGEPVEFPAKLKVNNSQSLETFFAGRHLAYHRVPDPENSSRQWLVKVRYDWGGEVPIEETIWKQPVGSTQNHTLVNVSFVILDGHRIELADRVRIRPSDDHRYVLLDEDVLRVLDAETGDIVLVYPTDVPIREAPKHSRRDGHYSFDESRVYYGEKARDFLATVEYPDEVMYPERMLHWAPTIVADKLSITHRVLRGGSLDCRTVHESDYLECIETAIEQHGAKYMWVWDVFQLNDMPSGYTSVQRIPLKVQNAGCSERVAGDLKVKNGSLSFFPIAEE